MPFRNESSVADYIFHVDIEKPEKLEPLDISLSSDLNFIDRKLPESHFPLVENTNFSMNYFVELHNAVRSFGVHNYKGARIPLAHNNINVESFRFYLNKFEYPHSHLLQFVEFGFPLGLWTDAYLVPCTKNHSSSYSHYSYVDKFVSSELEKTGLTGPFDKAPLNDIMLSPIMTAPKKPNSRRTVFDASFGLYSLNKNTPEKTYHETEYEFTFPKIDNLADIIAELGPGCFLWKRDLSRFFLQLKVDPYEYNRLGFVWRTKLYLFVSFVWGCRHAGYVGQWLTTAVAYILARLGLELTGFLFFVLNYADDFAGAEKTFERASLSFSTLGNLLAEINLIESEPKACPPATTMTYLGVSFNTIDMCLSVDSEKIVELKLDLKKWLNKTRAKKSDLQSILGKLLWVSRTVRFSRVFVSRIIAEIRKLDKQYEKTTLSREIKKDFLWWDTFLVEFSGVEIIPSPTVSLAVYGDACVQGGGGWNPSRSEFFSLRFPNYMSSPDVPIHIKEFIVVILSVRLWAKEWSGQKVVVYCDNDSVCDTCVYQKPKDLKLQQLLREFFLGL